MHKKIKKRENGKRQRVRKNFVQGTFLNDSHRDM